MIGDQTEPALINHPDSLWKATAIAMDIQPMLETNIETEVAIIGAGFTGCSAALHLREKNIEVVVIDAGQPGIGASGRNGGQVNPGIKRTLREVQQVWGNELGEKLYNIIGTAPDFAFNLIRKYNIECHPRQSGIIQPAYSKKSLDYLIDYGEYHLSRGAPVEILDKKQTTNLLGSDYYIGGFIDHRAGSVQPLSYCRGLAQSAISLGAKFYGNTPATSIKQHQNRKTISTPHGRLTAAKILVCTNGYTDLFPNDPLIKRLSKTIVPFYSYKVATEPLTDELQSIVLPGNQVVADTRRLLTYYRKDHQGRLVMGSAGGPYEALVKKDYSLIESRIHQLYPQIKNPGIEFRWCGKVCLTMDGVPHVHELDSGIYTGLGYNGRGVAMASLMGKWLAAMVSNQKLDTELIPVTATKIIPFHNIRKPFIKMMVHVKDFLDRIEK